MAPICVCMSNSETNENWCINTLMQPEPARLHEIGLLTSGSFQCNH